MDKHIAIENTLLEGGNGGSNNSSGHAPDNTAYGTGGGGGGGNSTFTNNTAGLGGNGGNGYVYLEWGEGSGEEDNRSGCCKKRYMGIRWCSKVKDDCRKRWNT